jgi:hypothetical protein
VAALVVLLLVLRDARPGGGPSPPAAEPPGAASAAPGAASEPAEPRAPGPARSRPAASGAPAAPEDPERALRTTLRARLASSLAEHFPERALSASELDAATDALLRLRRARLELRALPRTPENAERLRALRAEIGEASADFETVVELDPIEFTERVGEEEE